MISLKAPGEIEKMREAGHIVGEILAAVAGAAAPGVKLDELNALAAEIMRARHATSSFLGYKPAWAPMPYPGVLCLSVNETIVHGIPDSAVSKQGICYRSIAASRSAAITATRRSASASGHMPKTSG